MLHQTSGLASLSSAYRILDKHDYLKGIRLTLLTATEAQKHIKSNLECVLKNSSAPDSVISIKVDELAVEKRLRYKSDTNEVVGLCCQHTKMNDVIFCNEQFAENLSEELTNQTLHLATESCVFSLCNLGDTEYNAKPVLSMPICSHATANEQGMIFKKIFDVWSCDPDFKDSLLVEIGTDGDAVRRSVLHNMAKVELPEDVSFYKYLKDLDYMEMETLPMGVTVNYDGKHLCKRIRNNILSGSITMFGRKFDTAFLCLFLKYLNYSDTDINAMLSPDDKQNVPNAVKLLKVFSADINKNSLPIGFVDILPAVTAMNTICQGVLALFDSIELSIEEQLGRISTMSHTLFFLEILGDLEMPNVLYHDLQATVQNVFFTAAKYIAYYPEKRLHLFQLGSDSLEHLFRKVRTQNHDRNCDVYQLESRLRRAAILERYFMKHPDWKQKSVRLTGTSDHTNPSHWKKNLTCKDLSLVTSWKWGKNKAKKMIEDSDEDLCQGKTIMRPNGVYIGVSETDDDHMDDIEPENSQPLHDAEDNDELFCQFEDELETGMAETEHSITISLGGNEMYKSSAVRLISTGHSLTKSCDRLCRVQGLSKVVGKRSNDISSIDENDNNIITIRDPIGTICCKQRCLNLVVMSVEKIVNVEKKKFSWISRDAPEATIVGRPLKLEISGMWLEGKIGASNKQVEIKASLEMCIPVDVVVSANNYQISIQQLKEIFEGLMVKVQLHNGKLPSGEMIYNQSDKRILYQVNSPSEQGSSSVTCMCCQKKINKIEKMREHIGGHIIRKEIDSFCCG